jgi:hypothetical protein
VLAAATLAAALLAAAPVPDLALGPASAASRRLSLDPGPFQGRELVGAGLGTLAGDALVLGALMATYHLFTSGTVGATAGNFRSAAIGLGAVTLLVPPLGAVVGGHLAGAGSSGAARWKAPLLALAGQVAALAAGYLAAPQYWVVVPVQLALMSAGTSFGLHWGGSRARDLERAGAAPEPAVERARPPLALAPARCSDAG